MREGACVEPFSQDRPLLHSSFDNPPSASTLQLVPAISFEPQSLAGRHQAVRPWRLLAQDIATARKECSHGGQRTAPTDAPRLFRDPA